MTARVEFLEWDSDFWGARSARIHVSRPNDLVEAQRRCSEMGVEWSSVLVPSGEYGLLSAAVRCGYEIVDTRYTMSAQLGAGTTFASDSFAQLADQGPLAEIARHAFFDSRYYNDPHLDDRRCGELYEMWLNKSLTGELADFVFVDRLGSDVTGFITVRMSDTHASLPLVAISPKHQGSGVGRRLLATTLDWLSGNGAGDVEVVTQLTNVRAINLYAGAGFKLSNTAHWLHRWNRSAAL